MVTDCASGVDTYIVQRCRLMVIDSIVTLKDRTTPALIMTLQLQLYLISRLLAIRLYKECLIALSPRVD
jgi:hypothetical protein